MFRLAPDVVDPYYLLQFLLSQAGQKRLIGGATSVTQANINAPTVKAIVFPLAPLGEQQQVVARLTAMFGQAGAIEQAVQAARQRLDKLDQAILWRAFRGELVPQDPRDAAISVPPGLA